MVLSDGTKPEHGRDLDGDDYETCGQYTSVVGDREEVVLDCRSPNPSGKTLFVYLPRNDILKICGVHVYLPPPEGK